MEYSQAMQILVNEHETIESVLDAVEAVAGRADAGPFPREFYEKAVDFIATFADRCHHAKEEGQLFPLLAERGMPLEMGPIGCMLEEHAQGRAHVAAIRGALPAAAAGDAGAAQTVRDEAQGYCGLLRTHIQKENNILFRWGDQLLTPEDKDTLQKRFQCSQHGPLPPGTHEKYIALAAELRSIAGLKSAPQRQCCGAGACG